MSNCVAMIGATGVCTDSQKSCSGAAGPRPQTRARRRSKERCGGERRHPQERGAHLLAVGQLPAGFLRQRGGDAGAAGQRQRLAARQRRVEQLQHLERLIRQAPPPTSTHQSRTRALLLLPP